MGTKRLLRVAEELSGRLSTHRRLPLGLALLGILLTVSSLPSGWIADDYGHRLAIVGSKTFEDFGLSKCDLFRFLDGDPERNGRLMDMGILPWWSDVRVKGAFMRPVACVAHLIDYGLWPETPLLMHAQSVVWYGLLILAVSLLYRRFMGPTIVAGLAALLYTVDDAHGMPVAFLANRNALLATFFGVLCIISHDRGRREGKRTYSIVAPTLFVLSLLSAEAGIAVCAYLFAYAIFLDRGTSGQRISTMLPYLGIVVVWRILWTRLGYGTAHLWGYVDPLNEPLRFIVSAVYRIPIFLLGQWGFPPSDTALFLESMDADAQAYLAIGASLFLLVLAAIMFRTLKHDNISRFWALGMLLSVVPICAVFPSDRMLLFVGLGAMGLLARFLTVVFGKFDPRHGVKIPTVSAKSMGFFLVFVHLILAPCLLPFRAGYSMGPRSLVDRLMINVSVDGTLENQDLIAVNHPLSLLDCYFLGRRELEGLPVPRRLRILYPGWRPAVVGRKDANTLIIRSENGFQNSPVDRLFRNEESPFAVGDRVGVTGMTVEIMEMTRDNMPAEVLFRFDASLEDSSLRWLQWKWGEGFVPFIPPRIGEESTLNGI